VREANLSASPSCSAKGTAVRRGACDSRERPPRITAAEVPWLALSFCMLPVCCEGFLMWFCVFSVVVIYEIHLEYIIL
jgi:hypothetical protein